MEILSSIAALRDVRDRERILTTRVIDIQDFGAMVLRSLLFERLILPDSGPTVLMAEMMSEEGPLVARLYHRIILAEALQGLINQATIEEQYEIKLVSGENNIAQYLHATFGDGDLANTIGLVGGMDMSRDDLINMIFSEDMFNDTFDALEKLEDKDMDLLDAIRQICDDHDDSWYRADYMLLEYVGENLVLHYAKENV